MSENNSPIQIVAKICRWGKLAGGFKHTTMGLIAKIKRGGPSKSKNSGPVGKRKTRFYQAKFGPRPKKATVKTATPQQSLKLVEKPKG